MDILTLMTAISSVPATGDNFPIVPVVSVGVIAVVISVVLAAVSKKKDDNDDDDK